MLGENSEDWVLGRGEVKAHSAHLLAIQRKCIVSPCKTERSTLFGARRGSVQSTTTRLQRFARADTSPLSRRFSKVTGE